MNAYIIPYFGPALENKVTQAFDRVSGDARLHRVLGEHDEACVVEIWILQIKWNGLLETRVLYGRVLPSTHRNDKWSAPREDHFRDIDVGLEAQVIRVSLFCSAKASCALIRSFTEGLDLSAASDAAGIVLATEINSRFGTLTLDASSVFRPTMHLPARHYYLGATSRLSPIAGTSANSAAICSLNKSRLFHVAGRAEYALAAFAAEELKLEIGMDFAGVDAWRLGDIELLALPGLDDYGRLLFTISGKPPTVNVILLGDIGAGAEVRIRMSFMNDECALFSSEQFAALGTAFPSVLQFSLPAEYVGMVDGYELEIDARSGSGTDWLPCVRWGTFLYRGANLNMHIQGGGTTVKNDWLAVGLRPAHQRRLDAAQQLSRHTPISSSSLGSRETDAWVSANRQIMRDLRLFVPRKSEGQFFLRYSEGENTGRLELAEWLKELLSSYRDCQLIWFDPYMEDVGVNLLNLYGSNGGDYLIVTCVDKKRRRKDWVDKCFDVIRKLQGKTQKENDADQKRIRSLLNACKSWTDTLESVRLRVLALPEEAFHDRMLLILDGQSDPVVGFHLSNSIQLANKNYPLLVTPIPRDTLLKVSDYANTTVRESQQAVQANASIGGGVLFDSMVHPKATRRAVAEYDVFNIPRAGEVLSWWTGSADLAALFGSALRVALDSKGFLEQGAIKHRLFDEIPNSFWSQGLPLENFNSAWDAMGVILANTVAGQQFPRGTASSYELRQALYEYLDSDRPDAVPPPPAPSGVIDMTTILTMPLSELLEDATDPQGWFRRDTNEVSWGDYYAIKALWFTAPTTLIRWVEEGAEEKWRSNRRRQLGLKRAMSVITFDVGMESSSTALEALLHSSNDFIRWIGFVAFESLIQADPRSLAQINAIPRLGPQEKVRLLGWLVARSTRGTLPTRQALLAELFGALAPSLSDTEFTSLLHAMRGAFKWLHTSSPWMCEDVVMPLIASNRITAEQAATNWFADLLLFWKDARKKGSLLFRLNSEGVFSTEAAVFLASSRPPAQKRLLSKLEKELRACAQVIQAPLASQQKWKKFDIEFDIALWIVGLLEGTLCRLPPLHANEEDLRTLLKTANALVAYRWENDRANFGKELLAYRQQA